MIHDTTILPSSHIDAVKWDNCVAGNMNGMIYASTTYLNAMADNWHGIVIDDYRAIMPIPWRMKFGFRYAYIPPFVQQLGLVGDYDDIDFKNTIHTVTDFLSFGDFHFNFSNSLSDILPESNPRTNFVIDLSKGYEEIYAGYSDNLRRTINKNTAAVAYVEDILPFAAGLYQDQYSKRMPHVSSREFDHFFSLCQLLEEKQQCKIRAIVGSHTQILAIALLIQDSRRVYNLMNTTMPDGRKQRANEILLDRIIQEFSGQSLIFDFEGSDLPGVKKFYEKFGAVNQPYFQYRHNGLPWPLKLFK